MSSEKPKWELAFEDYEKGLKYGDIANKYEVTVNAVKKWKTRHWNKKGVQKTEKESVHKKEKVYTKKTKGAQKGNRNSVKHGAYVTYFHDLIDPQMLETINNEKYQTAKEEYEKELKDLRLRKLHLQQQIRDTILKHGDTNIAPNSVINTVNFKGNKEISSQVQEIKESTQVLLTPLQTELTKVQKAIIKVIELISKIDDSSSNELDKLDEILTRIKKSSES